MSESAGWELQTMTVDVRFDELVPDDQGSIRADFGRSDAHADILLPLDGRLLELVNELEAMVRERAREGLKQ